MPYFYGNEQYSTQAEVETAVTNLKTRLDNNPTDWCIVQVVTGSDESGWLIPAEDDVLNDSQILNLDDTLTYSICSITGADNYVGLTAAEVNTRVTEFRTMYAQWIGANIITETYAPTNEDMSGYV